MINRYFGSICTYHPEEEGLRQRCGKCVACNREKSKARQKVRYKSDPAFRSARQHTNKVCYDKKPHLALARSIARKLAQNQRVPAWADREKIKAIYQEAERTGMTVDHIIPLRGRLVSGLHVENNLQLLPGSIDYSKGNSFKVE